MSKKTLAQWSVVMIVVFGVTILVYPLLFNPDNHRPGQPVEATTPMEPVPPPIK